MRNLDRLRHFLAVAEKGKLNAAGAELGLSQPALTKSIRKLEAEYGLELFTRHARGVSLTAFGELLFRHAKQIETELRFADAELRAVRHGHSGRLRIGGGPFWGATLLPRAVARLQESFPALSIDLETGVNAATHPKLFDGRLDIVVCACVDRSQLPPFIEFRHLLDIHTRVYAGAGHPLRRKRRVGLADLVDYSWVEYQHDPEVVGRVHAVVGAAGRAPRFTVRASSLMAVAQLLRTGPFLAALPEPLLRAWPEIGLAIIPIRETIWSFPTGALFHRALAKMTPIRSLMAFLADEVAQLDARPAARQRAAAAMRSATSS